MIMIGPGQLVKPSISLLNFGPACKLYQLVFLLVRLYDGCLIQPFTPIKTLGGNRIRNLIIEILYR